MQAKKVAIRAYSVLASAAAFSTRTTKAHSNNNFSNMATSGPTIRIIPSDKLYVSEPPASWFGNPSNPNNDPNWTNTNWLKSRFHFSFAEYSNPTNNRFGVMKVMNDDLVQPDRGFGTHPHRDMEIITYIVHGSLTHQDSMGSKESLGRGSIQFMTAGSGVRHSEYNHDEKLPLRFIQTWILPRERGVKPNYGSYDAQTSKNVPKGETDDVCTALKNSVQHLASDVKNTKVDTPVKVNQDIDTYAAELELDQSVTVNIPKGRQAYLLCIEGSLELNGGLTMNRYDGAEIHGPNAGNDDDSTTPLKIKATGVENTENGKVAHFLLFSMKEDGSGRGDLA